MRGGTRLKLFKSLMTRKGGANLIATPESMSPDFAKWPDAYCGRRGATGYPNRTRASLFL